MGTIDPKGGLAQSAVSGGAGAGVLRVVTLGDSIIGPEATVEDYDPTSPSTAVGQYTTRARGFVPILNALLGGVLKAVYRGGITGNTVSQIAARRSAVLARAFDVLVEDGGTNDVSGYVALYSSDIAACVSAVVAARVATWQEAIAAGAKMVIALNCLPVGSSSTYTTTQKTALLRINEGLKRAAFDYGIVRLVDAHAAIVDPTSATGLVKASALYDNDRHPSAYGMFLIAKQAMLDQGIASLKRPRPLLSSALDCIQNDTSSSNILNTATGLVTGSTGVASGTGVSGGTVVTGVTMSRFLGSGASIAASIVAAADGVGNAQRATITSAVAGDQVRILVLPGITVTELPKGSWGYFECKVDVSSGVNLHSITVSCGTQYTGGTPASPLVSFACAASTSETGGGIVSESLILASEPVYFPADATALSFTKGEVYATFGGAGGAVVDVSRMRWVKL